MSKRLLSMLSIVLIVLPGVVFAQSWEYSGNRIAISSDGNSEPDNSHKWPTGDPDDWGATPAALAILAKLQMQYTLPDAGVPLEAKIGRI